MANTVGLKMTPLKFTDCCDRCGATAYVRAAMLSGDLLFCFHHYHSMEVPITRAAIGILDESGRLLELESH